MPTTPNDIFLPGLPRKILTRSSYNAKIAFRHKPIYDRLLDTHTDYVVPYEQGIKPSTFRTHLSEGLLWLVDNFHDLTYSELGSKYKQADYAALRGQIKFCLETGGVHIMFQNLSADQTVAKLAVSQGAAAAANMLPIDKQQQAEWKDKLNDFLADGSKKIFHVSGVVLSKADLDYVNKLIGPYASDFESRITPTELTIVR